MQKSIVIICKECDRKIRHMGKENERVRTRICPDCGTVIDVPA